MKLIIQLWINLLVPCFFGIGMGPSKEESAQEGAVGNIGSFATGTGEKDIGTASDFWNAIVSGDSTQLGRVLGPLYSNVNQRGNQELMTLNQFGTRSGGTAAAGQQVGDEMRREATTAESSLLGKGASELSSMGGGLLSTGLSAHEAAFEESKTIQEQKAAKLNDIFKSISSIATSFLPGGALAKVGGKFLSNVANYNASSQPSDTGNIGDYSASGAVG